ncbi:MAG TPA: hypothetical protein VG223_13830 [Solirubrobacteraceae bacterium]|jgi:predicted  nucleic acid-binding Zn-ribbon protein|nr:hypothetical protein [Solirubrobacteraceae bacterium]
MSDVFTSADAQYLLQSDPGEVQSLADQFHSVASQAESAQSALKGAQGDATWTGAAADAFRAQLGKLPDDLAKVQQSYGEVATALGGYQQDLASLRSQFARLQSQYESLQGSLSTAQGQLSSANDALTTAKQSTHATSSTPAVVNAHNGVAAAQGAVSNVQSEIAGIERQAAGVLSEFDASRSRAKSTVSSAAGIAPEHHWWQSVLGAVGNFMAGTGHVLWGIVKGVGEAAYDLPGDVANVFMHPLDLHDWAKLGEDAGEVAGAVALVAAIVIFPADALGLDAAAGVIETVGDGAELAGTVSGVEKTAADTGLAAEGQGSWGTVGFDVAGGVAGQVKVPGLGDAETSVENLSGKSAALEQFGLNRALGASASDARSALEPEQQHFLTTSIKDLSNPAKVSYMRSSTSDALEAAESSEKNLNLVNAGVHTVYEQGSKAVAGAVVPQQG